MSFETSNGITTAPSITIIDDLHPEDNAMLQALQSRSPASVEERLKKVQAGNSGEFMDKFYVGYGHRSIGDCGNTTIFIENVTMLAAKAIQDWPLYSGQESSTRYMDFSKAEFYDPTNSEEGRRIQENWRNFYLTSQGPVRKHLQEKYPRQEDEDPATYERAINARSFDILRGFLPAGAMTNLSWSTNLRQAQDHLNWLLVHPDKYIRGIAARIFERLDSKYPHSFRADLNMEMDDPQAAKRVDFQVAVMRDLYYLRRSEQAERSFLEEVDERCFYKEELDLLKQRPKGQEIPWFMANAGNIYSSFLLDFGSYRDLQRHRNGVIRMPLLTTEHGFHPWYLEELPSPMRETAQRVIELQAESINALSCSNIEKQNYIAMGFRVRCHVAQPFPAYVYRLELRSSKTVHPTLREVVHWEIEKFRQHFPNIPLHVDMDPDSWTVRRGKQTIKER